MSGYTYPDTSLPQPTHLLLLCCGVLCVHMRACVCVIIRSPRSHDHIVINVDSVIELIELIE